MKAQLYDLKVDYKAMSEPLRKLAVRSRWLRGQDHFIKEAQAIFKEGGGKAVTAHLQQLFEKGKICREGHFLMIAGDQLPGKQK